MDCLYQVGCYYNNESWSNQIFITTVVAFLNCMLRVWVIKSVFKRWGNIDYQDTLMLHVINNISIATANN